MNHKGNVHRNTCGITAICRIPRRADDLHPHQDPPGIRNLLVGIFRTSIRMNTIFLKSFPDVLASVLDSIGRESPLGHKSPPGDAPTYGKSAENQWTSNISENGHVEGLLLHSHRRFFRFTMRNPAAKVATIVVDILFCTHLFLIFVSPPQSLVLLLAEKGRTGLRNSERLEDPNGSNVFFSQSEHFENLWMAIAR